jgi:hypothetical protein
MSVLIKGMKMPEKCGSCDLFHVESPMHCTVVKGHKTVGAPYGMPRPDWCPLVEIPEPHGRLIDADRATAESIKGTGKRLLAIDTAPTVIEAEGSENHDD